MTKIKELFKDTYNSETKCNSRDKLHANNMYQNYISPEDSHFYLESKNLLTTEHLRKKGVDLANLHIVNGDSETCKHISQVVPNVTHDISTSYLSITENKFGTLWMDYCCTMEGNSKFCPIDDFEIILSRHLVKNGGIVGFTFSVRQTKKHWKKCSVRKHKLATQEINKSEKYHCFSQKETIKERNKSRWEHATIDFCETVLDRIKNKVKCNLEVVDFYRYQHKVENAPPQMYVFFVKVFY